MFMFMDDTPMIFGKPLRQNAVCQRKMKL